MIGFEGIYIGRHIFDDKACLKERLVGLFVCLGVNYIYHWILNNLNSCELKHVNDEKESELFGSNSIKWWNELTILDEDYW